MTRQRQRRCCCFFLSPLGNQTTPPETETGEIKVKRGSATVSAHPVLFPWLPLGGAREGRHSHTRLGRQFLTCECLIQKPGPAKAEIPKTHLTFSISEEVKKTRTVAASRFICNLQGPLKKKMRSVGHAAVELVCHYPRASHRSYG